MVGVVMFAIQTLLTALNPALQLHAAAEVLPAKRNQNNAQTLA